MLLFRPISTLLSFSLIMALAGCQSTPHKSNKVQSTPVLAIGNPSAHPNDESPIPLNSSINTNANSNDNNNNFNNGNTATSQSPVTSTAIDKTNSPTATTQTAPAANIPQKFSINGKIGVTTPKQAGSAFYVWTQDGQNFAIQLAGALNAGQTNISYNGQTATLTNDKGTLHADSPEQLLAQATGWQAPISQLPYWLMGQAAPSDNQTQMDRQQRLSHAQNGAWQADFNYTNASARRPTRITMQHPDGYKVVLTLNRLK